MKKLLPVPILLTSYNRIGMLKQTIEAINERTLYPYYLFVVDNNSTDGSSEYLNIAKVRGKIFDYLVMSKNVGQSMAFNKLIERVKYWQERRRPMDNWIVFSNEDILPPKLSPCWLEQMIKLFQYNEKDGLGALAMRIQRMARACIDEEKDIIYWNKGIPAVFRLMRWNDIMKLGEAPMGKLLKWNGNSVADKLRTQLKKRYGFTTHIYANHIGFMVENKGFPENVETFTVADNKKNERLEKPYPDIDPLTNKPIKVNHPYDLPEQRLRDLGKAEVTIFILTCNRPNGLRRAVNSIRKHTKNVAYKLLVIADNDDTEAYQYCVANDIFCILSSKQREFVAQANLGAYVCDTPYFVEFGDDLEIIQDDWLEKSLKIFKQKFPDDIGLLSYNDGINGGRIWPVGMSSKAFVQAVGGHLFYPKFKHYASDKEIKKLAERMGCFYHGEEIVVKHHHYSQTGKMDETYTKSRKYSSRDTDLRLKRDKDLLNIKNYYDFKN